MGEKDLKYGNHNKFRQFLNEDINKKRALYASQNFSLINKIALNLAKNEKTCRLGIKSKRKITGWDENYIELTLFTQNFRILNAFALNIKHSTSLLSEENH